MLGASTTKSAYSQIGAFCEPVKSIVFSPFNRANLAASKQFRDAPLVENMIKMSFLLPIAFNCRSKISLYDKSFDIAEITLKSVASDSDLIGCLFFSNRQTNSAAKCDESYSNSISLFKNKGFALNKIFKQSTSKFAII